MVTSEVIGRSLTRPEHTKRLFRVCPTVNVEALEIADPEYTLGLPTVERLLPYAELLFQVFADPLGAWAHRDYNQFVFGECRTSDISNAKPGIYLNWCESKSEPACRTRVAT